MRKDIEIVSSNRKVYIPDLTKYDAVGVFYASKNTYSKRHELTLTKYCLLGDVTDTVDYTFYFDEELKETVNNYYEQIKSVLKERIEVMK